MEEYVIGDYMIVPRADGVDIITPEPARERLFANQRQVKAIYQFIGQWKYFGVGNPDETISFGPLYGHTVVISLSLVPLWHDALRNTLQSIDQMNQKHH